MVQVTVTIKISPDQLSVLIVALRAYKDVIRGSEVKSALAGSREPSELMKISELLRTLTS